MSRTIINKNYFIIKNIKFDNYKIIKLTIINKLFIVDLIYNF
jgi:hypothetical protein